MVNEMTMNRVSVAEAKSKLSALLQTVEKGGDVIITRRGEAVARLSAVAKPRQPLDLSRADALRARQRPTREASAGWLRRLRDAARY